MLEILKTVTKEKNPKNIESFIKQNIRNPKELNLKEKKTKKTSIFGDEIFEKQNMTKRQYLNNSNNNNINMNNNIFRKGHKSVSIRIKNYYDNLEKENEIGNDIDNIENNMTLEGYKTITRGYFYNIPINLKDINTKILCVHSNINSFINITNISPLFNNDIPSYRTTTLKKINLNYKNNNIKKNWNQINSMMGYDLTDFKNDENIKRKLIIFDGSHDITFSSKENDNIIFKTLISYFN